MSATGFAASITYYTQIPDWILDSDISAQAIRLYLLLYRKMIIHRGHGGEVFPSRASLARELQVKTAETVDRALSDLLRIGAVTKQHRYRLDADGNPTGEHTSNLYIVHDQKQGGSIDQATVPEEIKGPSPDNSSHRTLIDQAVEITEDKTTEDKTTDDISGADGSAQEKKVRSRPPDHLFEAIMESCYGIRYDEILSGEQSLTDTEMGRIRKARKELGKVGATPEDIRIRAERYDERGMAGSLTPQTLTKMWNSLGRDHVPARSDPSTRYQPDYSAIQSFSTRLGSQSVWDMSDPSSDAIYRIANGSSDD